jgi:hypothetical protein
VVDVTKVESFDYTASGSYSMNHPEFFILSLE